MGITLLGVRTEEPPQRVVVKIPITAEPRVLERFTNEIRILSDLEHPNIVRFIQAGETDIPFPQGDRKLPWLAMEYLSGDSLRAILKKQTKARWQDVLPLLNDVLHALDYLHTKNLCHRDIKPDNLIFDPQAGVWKLVDFGIAKELIDNLRLTMTMAETNPGAWDYMSPEQSRGQRLDIRSDIYSLGLTAWEALIGVVPRPGAGFPSAMLGPQNVPPDVDTLIAKMTAHNPEDRYQTPAEVLAALREGAGEIERKEKTRKTRATLVRRLAIGTGIAAVAALAWFVADHFQEQSVAKITGSRTSSGPELLRRLQELEEFRKQHRFWGRRYADPAYEEAQRKAAEEELPRMRNAYAALMAELADAKLSDEDKFNRCEAFYKTYHGVRPDDPEVKAIHIHRDEFDAKITTAKATALAAKGQTKEALALCDQAESRCAAPAAVTTITEARGRIADEYAKAKLAEIEPLLAAKTESALAQAQTILTEVEKIVGPRTAIQSEKQRMDDVLWTVISEEANSALNRNDWETARRAYDRYIEISTLKSHRAEAVRNRDAAVRKGDDDYYTAAVKRAEDHLQRKEYTLARRAYDQYLEIAPLQAHREEVAQAKQRIGELEDDNDWLTVSDSANQNLAQHTFKQATDDYQNYLKKWPDGRHAVEARQALDQVVVRHFQYLGGIKNYDDFQEEFNKVSEMYPSEHARIEEACNWLVRHVHGEISRLHRDVQSGAMPTVAALDKIGQLRYSRADANKREYLDQLAGFLKHHLQAPTPQNERRFLYYQHRPPSDCVTMDSPPNVFEITIERIYVSLSDKIYKKIKGWGDADPQIRVILCRSNESRNYTQINTIFEGLGAVNQYSFSINVQKTIFFDQRTDILQIILDDADPVWGDKNIVWGFFPDLISRGGRLPVECEKEGTKFVMHYTMK